MSSLYEQLEKYRDSDAYAFHMPGHKRQPSPQGTALSAACGIDITEIDGFDNLHHAQGLLKEAQENAAQLYGAQESFFLVNGSTCGVLSAVAAATRRGDRILMARNCHRSAYHAAVLQELCVTYLYPDSDVLCGIADGIDPEEVRRELERERASGEKEASAVIITSPTYEGVASDVARIAAIVHSYGKILIVDEAHGAHFGFHRAFPENAVRQGADLVVHSLHKTLPSMTQTALLHVSGNRVDRERLRRYLSIFQTSSPSYVLMASADACLHEIKRQGAAFWEPMLARREKLLRKVESCAHLKVVTEPVLPSGHGTAMDPGKLVIALTDAVESGQELYRILKDRYRLQMEMAAPRYVLGILTPSDTQEGFTRLAQALLETDGELLRTGGDSFRQKDADGVHRDRGTTASMTMARACSLPFEVRPPEDCKGRIAAEFITPYPPGTPLVAPGEEITRKTLERIERYTKLELCIQGVEKNGIKIIKQPVNNS